MNKMDSIATKMKAQNKSFPTNKNQQSLIRNNKGGASKIQRILSQNGQSQLTRNYKQTPQLSLIQEEKPKPFTKQTDLSSPTRILQSPKQKQPCLKTISSIEYSPRKQASTSFVMSSISFNHQEEIMKLKSQLHKKDNLIKYLQRKLGNHIIRSMTKMNEQMERLQKQNEILSANLRITQGNNLRYLKSSIYGTNSPTAWQFSKESQPNLKPITHFNYEKKKILIQNKIHDEYKNPHNDLKSCSCQTDFIDKQQKETQSEKDESLLELQIENENLKILIDSLNTQIESLREQFSSLKDKIQNCFEEIEEIEPFSPRKSDSGDYSFKPKTEVERNYCDILEILEIEWSYYEKPHEIHEILVMQIRNLQKQNKKILQKFKKVQKESKNIMEERDKFEKLFEQEKSNYCQIKENASALAEALEKCNEVQVQTELRILSQKYREYEEELTISISQNSSLVLEQ